MNAKKAKELLDEMTTTLPPTPEPPDRGRTLVAGEPDDNQSEPPSLLDLVKARDAAAQEHLDVTTRYECGYATIDEMTVATKKMLNASAAWELAADGVHQVQNVCPDCGRTITQRAAKCRSCAWPSQSSAVLERLAELGTKRGVQAQVAAEFQITRQRVNQILKGKGK